MLIRGGTVWTEDGSRRVDVRVEAERIADIGELTPQPGEDVLDATALHVLPGMIDAHVHVDDHIGRFELADTWSTASEIAVRNGITTLVGFVTQQSAETLTSAVERCLARARGRSRCDFTFHLTPTGWPWDWREVEALAARGLTTFKLYTTYREVGLFSSYDRIAEVMAHLASLGARLLVHCEDDATLAAIDSAGVILTDPVSHTRLRPEEAEVEAIRRVIALAARTGCLTHVVHVSSAEGAEAIAAARTRGVAITSETAPHYLLLDDGSLRGPEGHRWLCTPPLRSPATRARMEALAGDGAFDLFATDHCAFCKADKDDWHGDFRRAAFGIAGIGALAPLLFELLATRHRLLLAELVRRLSANPARFLGAYPRKGVIGVGADADLVVLDPHGPVRPVRSSLADSYETYPGATSTLDVRHVLVRGRAVVRDGELVSARDFGGCLMASQPS
ncbi:MAG: dihydroorotase family protein [Thermoanaerobaculales bacterium]